MVDYERRNALVPVKDFPSFEALNAASLRSSILCNGLSVMEITLELVTPVQ